MSILLILSILGLAVGVAGLQVVTESGIELAKRVKAEIAAESSGSLPELAPAAITIDGRPVDLRFVAAASETYGWLDECERLPVSAGREFLLRVRPDGTGRRERLALRRRHGRVVFTRRSTAQSSLAATIPDAVS